MKKQIASLDTSFWINAYRVGIIHEVTEYFDIYVAENVADEIRRPLISGREALDASLFNKYLEDKRLHIKNPKKAVPLFGPGEREAIGLAQELKSILLIDDSRPYFYARSQGIKVVASIDLIVFFFDQGRLSYDLAQEKLKTAIGISQPIKEAALYASTQIQETKAGGKV